MNHIETMGKQYLATKLNISVTDLDCIGLTECSFVKEGAVLMQYNVTKKGHEKYKSTVGYRYGWE